MASRAVSCGARQGRRQTALTGRRGSCFRMIRAERRFIHPLVCIVVFIREPVVATHSISTRPNHAQRVYIFFLLLD